MQFSPQMTRLLISGLLAVPLAVLSGAHALSSASLRSTPELSQLVFPGNGLASEKLAYRDFADSVKKSLTGPHNQNDDANSAAPDAALQPGISVANLQSFASAVAPLAQKALQLEPLLPKAHVLLALSETDPQRRREIIALASKLNRRELALQGVVLQQNIDDGDYAATIDTLDQILRVHPERTAQFFPFLTNALAQRETMEAFTALLRRPLPWRDAFLEFAVNEPNALDNLAVIRQDISPGNLVFDQRLIAGLVGQGKIESANRVFKVAAPAKASQPIEFWRSEYVPFEWQLADRAGFRAQTNKARDKLEFSIDPGNGGTLASRLIPAPSAPFVLRLDHQIEPATQIKDMKIQLTCWGQTQPFDEQQLSGSVSILTVNKRPGCAYLEVAIVGRAWTGASTLTGSLGQLSVFDKQPQ